MTLSQMILALQNIAADLPEGVDPEVRVATQPNWPFEARVADNVVVFNPAEEDVHECKRELSDPDLTAEDREAVKLALEAAELQMKSQPPVVYIGEGQQIGYLAGEAKNLIWG